VPERAPRKGGEGLSLQTLVIAAAAAGVAAVVTSYFWQKGTLISAAMTPVIVTVVSEMLKRPAQKVGRSVSSVRSSAPVRESAPLAHGAGAGSPAEGPSRELPAPREPTPSRFSEIKVYRSEGPGRPRFGRVHWKIVGATAAIAFVVAVGVLTLPELLFGSSVSGSRQTTFFGGGETRHRSDQTKTTTDQKTTSTDQTKTVTTATPTDTVTVPQQTTPTVTTAPQQPAPPQSAQPQSTSPPQQQAAPQTTSP
jgi:hypothetical protein